ncbi:cytochrome P450 [Irpex rosettiformis]|uniref:Cytochrome P450 n=1 Tax=Irpex rosettiformis TaxID=378272 RepID=A0ACB8U4R3_9APHY|nr:cytochrome P450 [Irpex rosettiformis]
MFGKLLLFLLCSLFFFVARRYLLSRLRKRCLPPGPKPWPLLGNVLQIPDPRDWQAYKSLSDIYGPITYYEQFGKSTVLVSSHRIAAELFERRSHNYSDRSVNVTMGAELVGWNRAISLHPSGPRHSCYRKLLNNAVNPSAVGSLDAVQEHSAFSLVSSFLQAPDEWYDKIRSTITETLVKICFGRDCSTDEFPYVSMAARSHEVFNAVAVANSWAVDYLPILKYLPEWLPGMGFKRQAKRWRAELDEFVYGPYNIVKTDMDHGIAQPSYVASLIEAHRGTPNDEERDAIAWSAVSFFTGGVDTTTAAMTTFVMLMCQYPDIQRRAHEEIVSVVGPDRFPTIKDRPQLPFIAACIKEMFRMYPIVPLGVVKQAKQDDLYDGYFVPAGTTIVPNIWAMGRDPDLYQFPDVYMPDRFLQSFGQDTQQEKPGFRSTRVFGFGRRVCPGRHLAESMIFIHAACILAAFDLSKPRNSQGRIIEQAHEFEDGLITIPKPFKCQINPRMKGLAELVAQVEF